jgi:16S rRNA (guanine527-N7)-methyltransferase
MFHVKLDGGPGGALPVSGLPALPKDALDRLREFHGILKNKAVPLGAVSVGDRGRLWERHIADSLRALACLRSEDRMVADLGSGAGLPGIPLAIAQPHRRYLLVERNQRRAGFLELAVEELRLENVTVEARPIEEIGGDRADACVARALAGPLESWRLALRVLRPTGCLLYYAGRSWDGNAVRAAAGDGLYERVCAKGGFDWQGPIVMMTETP